MTELVHHLLSDQSKIAPNNCAIIFNEKKITYSSLNENANKVTQWLRLKGIRPRARIMLYGATNDVLVAALFGILKTGATAVPINPQISPEKIQFILRDCNPSAIIGDAELIEKNTRQEDIKNIPILNVDPNPAPCEMQIICDNWGEISSTQPPQTKIPILPDDLALIIYTSGSSMEPRGVMCPHKQIIFATTSINSVIKNTPHDIILCGLPLSFDYGLYQIFLAFQAGATLILEKNFSVIPAIPNLIKKNNVTGLPGVPALFSLLIRSKMFERVELPSLRYITSTGDTFQPIHIKKLNKLLPNVLIYSMYGLTECKRVSIMPPTELLKNPTSVGVPLPDTNVFIIDETGKQKIKGENGELIVSGHHVMKGYWNNPTETKRKFVKDNASGITYLHTGDIFYIDNNGLLHFVGRKDMFIKNRGVKISPFEIENAISGLEGVLEVGVVGVPDIDLGEKIFAFISITSINIFNVEKTKDKCIRSLSSTPPPDKFIISERPLPKNNNNKIDRIKLRERGVELKANSEEIIIE